jgi:hypothetical protein
VTCRAHGAETAGICFAQHLYQLKHRGLEQHVLLATFLRLAYDRTIEMSSA